MTLFTLALNSVMHRRFATVMTCLSIAFSMVLLLGVERIRESGRESFGGAISKTDLIVGPRTGNLALLLYSVFRIGSPNQNISTKTVEVFTKHPAIEWIVPFNLGDGYRGFPVVGVPNEFFTRYKYGRGDDLAFSAGDAGTDPNSAVLGAGVASDLNHKIGDKIVVSHGHSEDGDGFEKHEGQPLVVTGILESTGTPVDRSVWITLEAMSAMHKPEETDVKVEAPAELDSTNDQAKMNSPPVGKTASTHDHHHDHDHEEDGEEEQEHHSPHDSGKVSGFFLGTKDRSAALSLMREINEYADEPLTAIMPAVVLNDLWRTLAVGEKALSLVSAMVALVGICGMWVSLHILAHGRKREIAVLRATGASPVAVISLMTGEAVLICFGGIVLGFFLLYGGMALLTPFIAHKYGVTLSLMSPSSREWVYIVLVLAASAVAGLIPAVRAYRSALHEGLSVRF